VAYHGFEKVLLVNGHGSNGPLADLVARKTVLATRSLCSAVGWFSLAAKSLETVQETDTIAHADELETSLYLHLAPERVRFEKARPDNDVRGQFLSSDSTSDYPARFNDYWGRWTRSGVHGDPTAATAQKGKLIFEATVEALGRLVREWRDWPLADRNDQHRGPVQSDIRW
jgi:creatinine amidohydrolase